MHVRATSAQVQPGKMQEFMKLYNDKVAPITKAQKGFQGQYVMTDAEGKALAISLWDSEADMVASESSSRYVNQQLTKLGSFFVGVPTIHHYELSVEISA